MFTLSVVDKNNNVLNLLSSRSQVGIDKFTTCFSKESSLFEKLGLDEKKYRIIIENTITKEEKIFTTSKYRNIVYLYHNSEQIELFLEKVSKIEIEFLYSFFIEETLCFEKDKLSIYEKNKNSILQKIIDCFDMEEDEENYQRRKLLNLMREYFFDNYSYLKDLYVFLTNLGQNFGMTYENDDRETTLKIIERMKCDIKNAKSSTEDKFSENIGLKKLNRNNKFDDDNDNEILSFLSNYEDEDEKIKDLDMFMDSKKYSDIKKKKLLEKVLI